ncbi:CHAD domain-containing protein [Qaidamihabitans albus]|uniref:CHAD domain-containing protein n=1 Tax=Qaidamihabitans albus TaxID=2795733 RepID=UPI0018F159C2|nr:CHAD domain-containing protein [Qaidamihabitans albus]
MTAESLPETAELGLSEEPLEAGPDDSPARHVRAKVDAQLRELLAYEPGTRSGKDPEDLHQMRVATRRLRSVLKLAAPLLGPGTEQVRAELGWLGAALGEVRDHDVLIGHLREVVEDFEVADQAAARRLVTVFIRERGRAKRRLNRALSSGRYTALLRDTAQLTRQPDIEPDTAALVGSQEAGTLLVDSLRKPHRRLMKAVAALPADPPDDDLHALRIHGKRLRYTAELARPAAGKKQTKKIGKLVKAAKDLQTVLGEHQDAVVATTRMRELLDSQDAHVGFVAGRIAEREQARRALARQQWPGTVSRIDAAAQALLRS